MTDLMVVMEAPGSVEDVQGKSFVGPEARRLFSALEYYAELGRNDIYLTYLCKEYVGDDRSPKAAEIKPHLPELMAEVAAVQPNFIIALGRLPAKYLDKHAKLKDDHGCPRWCRFGEWEGWVIPWHDPAGTYYSMEKYSTFAEDAGRLVDQMFSLPTEDIKFCYDLVTEDEAIRQLQAFGVTTIGFDTETTGPTRGKNVFMTDEADMVGWSMSWREGQGVYVAAREFGPGMKHILESEEYVKVCHNAKFEYKILRKVGVEMAHYEDTKLAAYLCGEPSTGLKTLARQWLGVDPTKIDEVIGTGKKRKGMDELDPADIKDYAAADADNTLRLWDIFRMRMSDLAMSKLYYDVELPVVPMLGRAEAKGILVDAAQCEDVIVDLVRYQSRAWEEAYLLLDPVTPEFNLDSPSMLEFELRRLGAPLTKKTPSESRYAVDKDVLEELENTPWRPDLVAAINKYRSYGKLLSYPENFLTLRSYDGRLHPSLNQCGHFEEMGKSANAPATGRLSSSGPNMTNVPHHHATLDGIDWSVPIRDCITVDEGYLFLTADLAQEEPRIIAVVAGDETLKDGFANDKDIYRPATEAMYPHTKADDQPDNVWKRLWSDWERFNGKTFLLAFYYGAEASRLKDIDHTLDNDTVNAAIKRISEAHPARKQYLQTMEEELIEHGYAISLFGRKRWFPDAWVSKRKWKEEVLRQAANHKIQGTAGDILKIAIQRIDEALAGRKSHLLFSVHDEIVLQVWEPELDEVLLILKDAFSNLLTGVELVLEAKVGKSWGTQTDLEVPNAEQALAGDDAPSLPNA